MDMHRMLSEYRVDRNLAVNLEKMLIRQGHSIPVRALERVEDLVGEMKEDIQATLEVIQTDLTDEENREVHVRFFQGSYNICTGDFSYVQDHRGFFSTVFITDDSDIEEVTAHAIEEILDSAWQSGIDPQEILGVKDYEDLLISLSEGLL